MTRDDDDDDGGGGDEMTIDAILMTLFHRKILRRLS